MFNLLFYLSLSLIPPPQTQFCVGAVVCEMETSTLFGGKDEVFPTGQKIEFYCKISQPICRSSSIVGSVVQRVEGMDNYSL